MPTNKSAAAPVRNGTAADCLYSTAYTAGCVGLRGS